MKKKVIPVVRCGWVDVRTVGCAGVRVAHNMRLAWRQWRLPQKFMRAIKVHLPTKLSAGLLPPLRQTNVMRSPFLDDTTAGGGKSYSNFNAPPRLSKRLGAEGVGIGNNFFPLCR